MISSDLISIVMPAYNSQEYISACIKSVLGQTYSNFEFIIVDDASTDKTRERIEEFKDERIVLIKKSHNSGIANTLNHAIALAKGKYVARMDNDDICEPDRLEKQYHFMEAHPDVILCGSNYSVMSTARISELPTDHHAISWHLLLNSSIAHPTVMFRNQILKDLNVRYKPEYVPADDYKLWTELVLRGRVANISKPLLKYRHHDSQMSVLQKTQQKKIVYQIRKEYAESICGKDPDIPHFTEIPISSSQHLQKYISVESKLITAFKKKGIVISSAEKKLRRKIYLLKSIEQMRPPYLKMLYLHFKAGLVPSPRLLISGNLRPQTIQKK